MTTQKNNSLKDTLNGLNTTQRNNLNKLRERLEKDLKSDDDDIFLLRFLKARNYDVDKAEKMLSEHLKFRKKVDLEIDENYQSPIVFEKYCSLATLGNDIDGDPVTYVMMGALDYKGIAYSTKLWDQAKFCINILNQHHRSSTKPFNEAVGTFILDLDGISFATFATSKLVLRQHLSLIRTYEQNFPETLKACYVINVPSIFYFWFNIYKQVIDFGILQKIFIFGKDQNNYQEALLKIMDADKLPVYLGGKKKILDDTNDCFSPCRREFMKIPTSYYMTTNDAEVPEPGVDGICIKERASFDCRVRVDVINSTLKWYFRTLNYNIKFGIFYISDAVPQTPKLNRKYAKASNKTLKKVGYETIFPIDFVESHVIPERGEYTCEKVGTYIFRFDNTFSWMTPKELSYKVDMILPKQLKTTA